jgi:hypothetical protein
VRFQGEISRLDKAQLEVVLNSRLLTAPQRSVIGFMPAPVHNVSATYARLCKELDDSSRTSRLHKDSDCNVTERERERKCRANMHSRRR